VNKHLMQALVLSALLGAVEEKPKPKCPRCEGSGQEYRLPFGPFVTCPRCGGSGVTGAQS